MTSVSPLNRERVAVHLIERAPQSWRCVLCECQRCPEHAGSQADAHAPNPGIPPHIDLPWNYDYRRIQHPSGCARPGRRAPGISARPAPASPKRASGQQLDAVRADSGDHPGTRSLSGTMGREVATGPPSTRRLLRYRRRYLRPNWGSGQVAKAEWPFDARLERG
jgi:hypothetical protein